MRTSTLISLFAVVALAAASSSYVRTYAPIYALQDPSGTYAGSKSVLGQSVKATMLFSSSTKVKFTVSGPVTIDCDNEDFTYEASSGLVSFPNINTKGDCMHDALSKYGATLNSVKYDSSADHITVAIKVSIVSVNIELDHTSESDVLRHPEIVFAPAPPSPPLADLAERYFHVFAGANPSGTYTGSKTILGVEIDAKIVVTASYFSLIISGAADIECDDEAYTYSDGAITITNAGKSGDCIHDQLQTYDLLMQSLTYDASSDSITADIKVEGFLNVQFVLDKASGSAPSVSFEALVDRYLALGDLQDPSGTYKGSKSVLGVNVDVTVATEADMHFSLELTGPVTISCDQEPYSYKDGILTPTNIGKSGDCLHDALAANKVTLQSIAYDSASDVITVNVKYSIFKLAIELKHVSAFEVVQQHHVAQVAPVPQEYNLPMLYNTYYKLFMLQDPAGTYEGSKTVLGQNFDITISIESETTLSFQVSGALSVKCEEPYTYSDGVISLTDIGKDTDCVNKALKQKSATLESITYDGASDEVVATLKALFLTISVTLKHQ